MLPRFCFEIDPNFAPNRLLPVGPPLVYILLQEVIALGNGYIGVICI